MKFVFIARHRTCHRALSGAEDDRAKENRRRMQKPGDAKAAMVVAPGPLGPGGSVFQTSPPGGIARQCWTRPAAPVQNDTDLLLGRILLAVARGWLSPAAPTANCPLRVSVSCALLVSLR